MKTFAKMKTKMFAMMMLIAVSLVFAFSSTFAVWNAEDGETGVAPGHASIDFNIGEKYFTYEEFTYDGIDGWAVTGFSNDGTTSFLGGSKSEFIFPTKATVGGTEKPVLGVKNTIFQNTLLKEIPRRIVISPTIRFISDMAFAGLPNLLEVEYAFEIIYTRDDDGDITGASIKKDPCHIGDYAFIGCGQLESVVTTHQYYLEGNPTQQETTRTVTLGDDVYAGTPYTQP